MTFVSAPRGAAVWRRPVSRKTAHRQGCLTLAVAFLVTSLPAIAQQPPGEQPPAETDGGEAASPSVSVEALVKKLLPSVVTIRTEGRDGDELGVGTGFVIDSSGLIATNLHVIAEGRRFEVQLNDESRPPVVAIEASDRATDLALIRIDPQGRALSALPLADAGTLKSGRPIVAIGNPLGLRNSVVRGVVSAVREVEGRELIQLAIPIQPGNSGGPLVDLDGRVHGILNMKSAVDDNLGFAIPVEGLRDLQNDPNPVAIDRWVRFGRLDEAKWETLFGGLWRQRAGRIAVGGAGQGFGGRTLCLQKPVPPEVPFDVAVDVRLEEESGAAGLVFHSDGQDRHYGFYPSGGKLRLSAFRGPDVFAWEVLAEVVSDAYRPGDWNRLRVRITDDQILCFVNGEQVIASRDQTFSQGRVGLAKFRETEAEFRRFAVADDLAVQPLSETNQAWLAALRKMPRLLETVTAEQLQTAAENSEAIARQLDREAFALQRRVTRMQRLAADVRLMPVLEQLSELLTSEDADDLARGALLIAALDAPTLDIDSYLQRLEQMASEVRANLSDDATPPARMVALDNYLFDENGFHGGRDEYYHPANSHLHRVIDEREGLPITLSILYIDLARRLGVTVEGVGLPGHFVVRRPAPAAAEKENEQAEAEEVAPPETGQLIDVFDRGEPLDRQEAATLTRQFAGRRLDAQDLKAQSVKAILTRVLRNLIGSAQRDEDLEALRRYTEGLVTLHPDDPQYRMMRVIILHQTDRDHRALGDLEWLIEQQPPGMDLPQLIRMRDFLLE